MGSVDAEHLRGHVGHRNDPLETGLGGLGNAEVVLEVAAALLVVGTVTAEVGVGVEDEVAAADRAIRVGLREARRVGANAVGADAADDLLVVDLLLPQHARLRVLTLGAGGADVDRADPGAVALRLVVALGPGADGGVEVGVGDRADAARALFVLAQRGVEVLGDLEGGAVVHRGDADVVDPAVVGAVAVAAGPQRQVRDAVGVGDDLTGAFARLVHVAVVVVLVHDQDLRLHRPGRVLHRHLVALVVENLGVAVGVVGALGAVVEHEQHVLAAVDRQNLRLVGVAVFATVVVGHELRGAGRHRADGAVSVLDQLERRARRLLTIDRLGRADRARLHLDEQARGAIAEQLHDGLLVGAFVAALLHAAVLHRRQVLIPSAQRVNVVITSPPRPLPSCPS